MKHRLAIAFTLLSIVGFSQSKDRIAVIDSEYILKKSPEYQEAEKELKKRANDWDAVIDRKKKEIKDLKDELAVERPLLTQQLIDEKQEDITILERELLTYQHEKYGPNGDYFIQKTNLVKPVQDQIFTIVNEISEKKKYGVVLDKNDENAMLYADKRIEISDLVIRELEKTRSRSKLSKKEIQELEIKEQQEEAEDKKRSKREELAERQKELERKKEDTIIDDYLSKNPNFDASPEQLQKNKAQEQADAIKRKQEEIRKQQEERVAEQKRKIEEQKLAVEQARIKALEDAEKKKQQILDQQKLALEKQKQLQEEQAKKQDEIRRQQLLKKIELEKKQAEKLAERQKIIAAKKQEMERVRNEKIKEQEDIRNKKKQEAENRQKELQKLKESNNK